MDQSRAVANALGVDRSADFVNEGRALALRLVPGAPPDLLCQVVVASVVEDFDLAAIDLSDSDAIEAIAAWRTGSGINGSRLYEQAAGFGLRLADQWFERGEFADGVGPEVSDNGVHGLIIAAAVEVIGAAVAYLLGQVDGS